MRLKILYLLRHAKAAAANPGGDDHERPLNERGNQDAQRIGIYCRDEGIRPQRVLCSTSLRTRQTLQHIESALGVPLKTHFSPHLYLPSPKEILAELAALPEDVSSILIVGHNPAFHQLALDLTSEGDEKLLQQLSQRFPTGTLAEIGYPAEEWNELGPRKGVLHRFVMPKSLLAKTG